MRKILVTIITILLIVLAVNTVNDKLKIGDIEILGLKEIEKQDEKLKQNIELGKLAVEEYNATTEKTEKAYTDLLKAKEDYEEKVATITAKNTEEAKLLQNYSIEFLWIQIGLHQKSQGVELDLTLSRNGSTTETDLLTNRQVDIYNMQFEVTGSYEAITDFIYAIEEDSKLGFEINDFKLNPGTSESNLVAQFTCTDIRIYTDSVNNNTINYGDNSATNENNTTEEQNTQQNNNSESTTDNNANTNSTNDNTNNNTNENGTNDNSTNENTNRSTNDNNTNENTNGSTNDNSTNDNTNTAQ